MYAGNQEVLWWTYMLFRNYLLIGNIVNKKAEKVVYRSCIAAESGGQKVVNPSMVQKVALPTYLHLQHS